MSLCSKTKTNTLPMCEVLDKDTIKSEFLPHWSVSKRGGVSKNNLAEVIQHLLYKLKTVISSRLFLHFHDVVSVGREQRALQTLAQAVVSVRVFCAVAHARACATIVFV